MKMLILGMGVGIVVAPYFWALVGLGYGKFRTWYFNRLIGELYR